MKLVANLVLLRLLVVVGLLFPASFLMAQDAVALQAAFEDWRLHCGTGAAAEKCQLTQAVATQEGDAPVFLLSISARPQERASYGVITVPVGVYLAHGVEIFVDKGRAFKVLFEVCDVNGCYAGFKLDGAILQAFRAGQSARFRVWTAKSQAVDFPISLNGFSAGWAAFQKVSEK